MSKIGVPLQRFPGKQEKEASPQPMRAEAIALRRIIVERGTWLSPFMNRQPIPKLTEAEATCDLVKLAEQQLTDRHVAPRHAVLDRVDAPTKKELEKKSHKAKPKPLPTLEEMQASERQEGRERYHKKKLQKDMSVNELRSVMQGGKKKKKVGEQSRMKNTHK
jgi:hypothetical protein